MTSEQSNPSPYLHANQRSRLFHRWNFIFYLQLSLYHKTIFSWITQLFDKSHKQKTLELTDLYDLLPQYESVRLAEQLEDTWFDDIKRYPNKPSLFRATVRSMGWKPLLIGSLFIPIVSIPRFNIILSGQLFFLKKIAVMIQPLLLISLMDFFEPCSTMSSQFASFLALITVLIALLSSFIYHQVSLCLSLILLSSSIWQFYHFIFTYGMQMRITYHGLIYRKVRINISIYIFNLMFNIRFFVYRVILWIHLVQVKLLIYSQMMLVRLRLLSTLSKIYG